MTVSIRRDAPPARSDAGRGRGARGTAASGRLLGRIRKGGLPYLFLLPALLLELLVHFIPMVFGILISFKQLTLFFIRNWTGAPWAGLGNYRVAVDFHGAIGSALLHSFVVTCAFTVLAVGLSWLFGTAAAILTQDSFRGRGALRTIFLTPFALPVYASVIIWAFMFQYNNGLVNELLHNVLGITSRPSFWLIGHNSFFALVIISIWRNWPFAFLCVMAGLQGIPRDLYEASAIDGAGHLAADPPDHDAVAAGRQPGPGPGAVPVDLQRLHDAVRALRRLGAARRTSSRSTSTTPRSSTGTSARARRCRCSC